MAALWARIAPDHPADPASWFTRMWREHGGDVPVAVLTRFVESGRTLADLDYPARYQAYFRACCTRLAADGAAAPPSRPRSHDGGAGTPRVAAPRTTVACGHDYRQDLRSLYLADRHAESNATAEPDTETSASSPRPTPGRGPPDAPRGTDASTRSTATP